ncbi:MAG: hypothetical protein K0S65_35 [Labilithrix sp.]|nr:hypothetical protein [Labilithrix sp.]
MSDAPSSPLSHLTWVKGGHAEVVSVESDAIVLRSTTSAPPGARLEAKLTDAPGSPVKVKSHGTHKEADGSFTLKGRLIDATRELRDRLTSLAAGKSQSQSPAP